MFFQFEIIINVLVSSFCFIWVPKLWIFGHYKYFISFSAGTVFIRQNYKDGQRTERAMGLLLDAINYRFVTIKTYIHIDHQFLFLPLLFSSLGLELIALQTGMSKNVEKKLKLTKDGLRRP